MICSNISFADLGIDAYKICMVYKAKYPSFESEMWNLDMSKDLSMKGEAKIEYGKGTDCSNAEGVVGVKFQYSTTAEARESLKEKPYYKKCMESKASSEWSGRNANPLTWPCLRTYMDGTRARKYVWDVKLEKVTDRARNIISTVKSIAKVRNTYITMRAPYLGHCLAYKTVTNILFSLNNNKRFAKQLGSKFFPSSLVLGCCYACLWS